MDLVSYYNKFNEDKRLLSRHGQVEFNTTIDYILRYINEPAGTRIVDIGAGTGRYSIFLASRGYEVTSVELVKYNLGILKKHAKEELTDGQQLNAYQGDARNLKKFKDESFDATLLLGPMYHLHSLEDKVKALSEAIRVTKKDGVIFVAYVMADYAVVKHGFMEGHIKDSMAEGALSEDYNVYSNPEELYDYVRLSDIDEINRSCKQVMRQTIITPDGPADYIRQVLNEMDEESFKLFLDYQLKNAERPELIGAGSHTVDILRRI